jgi:hypothetical protein
VVRDRHGNLAAATSTGGMTAKPAGRVGDTPVFGAGTWADNDTCAVSATGVGEFFVRWAVAHEIVARMCHRGDSMETAAGAVVAEFGCIGGHGGVIAVDHTGAVALPLTARACIGGGDRSRWSRINRHLSGKTPLRGNTKPTLNTDDHRRAAARAVCRLRPRWPRFLLRPWPAALSRGKRNFWLNLITGPVGSRRFDGADESVSLARFQQMG